MKKTLIVIGIILLLIAGVIGVVEYALKGIKPVKPVHPQDDKELVNIRAAIISKLQKIIKDGSNGLYVLTVKELGVDVAGQTVNANDVRIEVDSAAYRSLETTKMLPDDVFKFSTKTLHIDGLGIDDLIHRNRLSIGNISMTDPIIETFHKNQPYNKEKRRAADTASLYQRIMPGMQKIAVKSIVIQHGNYIHHITKLKDKVRNFKDISIDIEDVLIDSSTQFATDRFLFAKRAYFEMDHYDLYTEDSLYMFKVGKIAITADQHRASVSDITFLPLGGKRGFESRLRTRKDMYEMGIAKIDLEYVDWWSVLNEDKFFVKNAILSDGFVKVYLDRTLRKDNSPNKPDNFPQQELPEIPFPLSVQHTHISNLLVSYEEVNPDLKKSGTITFDHIKANLENTTNVPAEIGKNTVAVFTGSCMFMKKAPLSAKFQFYLSKNKRGAFIADGQMSDLDNVTVNSIAEPIGLVSLRSGYSPHATVHITGNNYKMNGTIAAEYNDLSVVLLKTDSTGDRLRRKGLIDFAANTFLIKKNNPANGKLRKPDFSVARNNSPNFFNFFWSAIRVGLLKTAGVPERFANL